MPKIKITRYKGASPSGTGKNKDIQVTVSNKKGSATLTRSVTKDGGKKTTERSVVRNLRQGSDVKKTKEDGVKTKTFRTMVDRDGGKTYEGTDRKMFKGANKLNKVIEKRGRAADVVRKNQEQPVMSPAKLKTFKMQEYKVAETNFNDARNVAKKGVGSTNKAVGIKRP